MTQPIRYFTGLLGSLALCLLTHSLAAQAASQELTRTILQKDSLFWQAYNACEIDKARPLLANDVEFYHDKGGVTLGVDPLLASLKKNLCTNRDSKLRREVVAGSVKIFPLRQANVIYGAILIGEHLFYLTQRGQQEQVDGMANFTHVWLLKEGKWQMARVLSYDHRPVPYVSKRRAVNLSTATLGQYVGRYEAPRAGTITITQHNESLRLALANQQFQLIPEQEGVFFINERDLTFSFSKNDKGEVVKLVVRENGQVVEEAVAVRN